MPNIGIVWDFDGTLTPDDSTTKVVESIGGDDKEFWGYIKSLRGDQHLNESNWEHILASDAPIWMYALSRMAVGKKIPLNAEFFRKFVLPKIQLHNNTLDFLKKIKSLEKLKSYKGLDLKIHHFVVSAGLKDLIVQVFPKDLVTSVFGCRYKVVAAAEEHKDEPESVPVFCMDETMKTRSLFEISKGSFNDPKKEVNTRVEDDKLWAPFKNIIYVGDGDTDIPALSLTRRMGGVGVIVYNPKKSQEELNKKYKRIRADKRADLITAADFSLEGELFKYIKARCTQIKQRYRAESEV